MKIIQVNLRNEKDELLKSWFGIDEIPQFNIEYNSIEIANYYLEFKRLDLLYVNGFGIRLHKFLIQSDGTLQKYLEAILR